MSADIPFLLPTLLREEQKSELGWQLLKWPIPALGKLPELEAAAVLLW